MTSPRLHILANSLYELDRGVRALFLMTVQISELPAVVARLARDQVAHFTQPVNAGKANVFFGKAAMVETARWLARKPLNHLSPEEDFMLGTLLGYDREGQCQRYLNKMAPKAPWLEIAAG
jgi:hypothetical protein